MSTAFNPSNHIAHVQHASCEWGVLTLDLCSGIIWENYLSSNLSQGFIYGGHVLLLRASTKLKNKIMVTGLGCIFVPEISQTLGIIYTKLENLN